MLTYYAITYLPLLDTVDTVLHSGHSVTIEGNRVLCCGTVCVWRGVFMLQHCDTVSCACAFVRNQLKSSYLTRTETNPGLARDIVQQVCICTYVYMLCVLSFFVVAL